MYVRVKRIEVHEQLLDWTDDSHQRLCRLCKFHPAEARTQLTNNLGNGATRTKFEHAKANIRVRRERGRTKGDQDTFITVGFRAAREGMESLGTRFAARPRFRTFVRFTSWQGNADSIFSDSKTGWENNAWKTRYLHDTLVGIGSDTSAV